MNILTVGAVGSGGDVAIVTEGVVGVGAVGVTGAAVTDVDGSVGTLTTGTRSLRRASIAAARASAFGSAVAVEGVPASAQGSHIPPATTPARMKPAPARSERRCLR
jgi:hypothetical protein